MDSKNVHSIPAKPTSTTSVYDDDNIPDIDIPDIDIPDSDSTNVIPDEVPRKDGPGGEESSQS